MDAKSVAGRHGDEKRGEDSDGKRGEDSDGKSGIERGKNTRRRGGRLL